MSGSSPALSVRIEISRAAICSLRRVRVTEITLFKSLGLAIEDIAAAQYVYAQAQATGRGVTVHLGGTR